MYSSSGKLYKYRVRLYHWNKIVFETEVYGENWLDAKIKAKKKYPFAINGSGILNLDESF